VLAVIALLAIWAGWRLLRVLAPLLLAVGLVVILHAYLTPTNGSMASLRHTAEPVEHALERALRQAMKR
jgi:hypothetical protein